MPTRPDLRDLASNVREAFADADRDTLLDVLTFVVKEYVVEGPPPMLMHQAETIAELGGMTFAQLITALQTRLDLPELGLFAVDGEQVSVRIGGVMHPLQPGRTAPAAELPRPAAGVRVVETNVEQRTPAQNAAASAARPPQAGVTVEEVPGRMAPPPRGLSVRGAPTSGGAGGGGGGEARPDAAQGGAQPAQGAASADKGEKKPEGDGDDAAARFSLLELD